jgi:hypothetical protein
MSNATYGEFNFNDFLLASVTVTMLASLHDCLQARQMLCVFFEYTAYYVCVVSCFAK